MKLENPKFIELLAAEYVLGTLQGPARLRFKREMEHSRVLQGYVAEWEQRLGPLAELATPVSPPARVWTAIHRKLERNGKSSQGFWHRIHFWRPVGIFASALALLLLVYLGSHYRTLFRPSPSFVAVINDEKSQPLWYVSLDPKMEEVKCQALTDKPAPPGKSYELWMLPGEGAPISLGLLPEKGQRAMPVPAAAKKMMLGSKGFAVSLEPKGGSPTGAPTGPVVYQANLIALSKT